jgi:hypothetical protein
VSDLFGIPVIESTLLPMPPSDGAVARRLVRHGLADVLRWLGEDVGPAPDAQTEVLMVGNTVHASAAIVGLMRTEARKPAPTTRVAPVRAQLAARDEES